MGYEVPVGADIGSTSVEAIAVARAKLSDCIAYLDSAGLGAIAAHTSLALERLEAIDPSREPADD